MSDSGHCAGSGGRSPRACTWTKTTYAQQLKPVWPGLIHEYNKFWKSKPGPGSTGTTTAKVCHRRRLTWAWPGPKLANCTTFFQVSSWGSLGTHPSSPLPRPLKMDLQISTKNQVQDACKLLRPRPNAHLVTCMTKTTRTTTETINNKHNN